ncbi:MAG: protein-export chaperone SecB [Melioribacteraceae bacterium]
MKTKDATKELNPQEYNKHLKNVELNSISLVEIKTKLDKSLFPVDSVPTVNVSDTYDMNLTANPVYNCATLKINVSSNSDKNKDVFLKIEAKYHISFDVEGTVPEAFWAIYQKYTLPIQLWPYFRELVQNITTRMNIPSLTLPIRIR